MCPPIQIKRARFRLLEFRCVNKRVKVIQVHNKYRIRGGEDTLFHEVTNLLKRRGNDVVQFSRDSQDLRLVLFDRLRAFVQGIYSLCSARDIAQLIEQEHPDIVHVHNVYPLISPSVLSACRKRGVPVVLRCSNYRLICPKGLLYDGTRICKRCKRGREYWCVLKNCRSSIPESMGYALRAAVVRKLRLFLGNITLYLPPTHSVKRHLVNAGFPETRIVVLPNFVSFIGSGVDPTGGKYIAYAGRISPEKGVGTLLEAAQRTGLPVHLAGDYTPMPKLVKSAPHNARFIGPLNRSQLVPFYQNARFLIVPSVCLETFGLVAAEAMSHGLPVIASRMGGLMEVVDDDVTGCLFEPGNAADLAAKMKLLWGNPDLCRKMGQAGREKVVCEYSEDVYYGRLMAAYKRAIELNEETHATKN